jgi:hypothetical protein
LKDVLRECLYTIIDMGNEEREVEMVKYIFINIEMTFSLRELMRANAELAAKTKQAEEDAKKLAECVKLSEAQLVESRC